ncbi:MAG: clan AA aspartic protease [Planctomycetes bacterium]|nr:clan AA aspartic protease [Planctomycetota bacterium]
MMLGCVNARLEAKLRLTIIGPTGITLVVDAIIDTGFSGALILPSATVAALGLVRRFIGTAMLGDGTTRTFDTFGAEVVWNGAARGIVVSALGNEALVGTGLLSGHKLTIVLEDGGAVEVEPL